MTRWTSALVGAGSSLAVAGTVHAAINVRLLRRPSTSPRATSTPVSVLVPARDEADAIAACLRAVLAQQRIARLEVVVLDDGSIDGTAHAARAVAPLDDRLRVLTGRPLPSGWLGKPHACAQLAAAADPGSGVLVFVDADVRLEPYAVAAAVGVLDDARLDVVCPYPRQLAGTIAERLVQPLLQWSWLTFLPLRLAERSPRPSVTAGNGQFLVVRRDAYLQAGGHEAVRAEVLDDIALVRAVKSSGGRGGIVDGTRLATCRMYRGWPQLRDGYGKSLWSAFGSGPGAAAAVGVLFLAYIVPPVAAMRGSRFGLVGYLGGVAGRTVAARATGGTSWPDAFGHPASVAMLGWLTARSVRGRRRGALHWKGRPVGSAS